ncbi:hypothetical protein ACFVP0_31955 [Streptomyces cinereoruber]|uniref:AMIN-like domain-containing (lipo)protein n=1 Tax=Streptomyces cinereoruber TaxID=67260 RepID=UPI00368D6CC8
MRVTRSTLARLVVPAASAVLATLGSVPTTAAAASQNAAEVCEDICVNEVRAATHTGYDRVVFGLGAGLLPAVEAAYGASPWYMTPGGEPKEMSTRGSSYLFLSFKNAEAKDFSETNPHVESFNLPTVKATQLLFTTGSILGFSPATDFGIILEGSVSRYNVFTLTQPNRVVIDVYR